MKFIVVIGGVISGLGKGITISSIGKLLKSRGFSVTVIKIDPYLNCDAGTMNPYQHGEVFVLDDGGEVDLDFGNYERFLDCDLTKDHNITTGKIYSAVIEKERRGAYLGKTVQIIPHVTNEIKECIWKIATSSNADIVLIEVGGTVGDIESMPYIEALRQLKNEVGPEENILFIHTTLIPTVGESAEQKTKPTQHSVKELRSLGVQPNIIIGRCSRPLDFDIRKKISVFCDVPIDGVISAVDVKSIYDVPQILEEQGLTDHILKKLRLEPREKDLHEWLEFTNSIKNAEKEVDIALVGKYTGLHDAYMSYTEALLHAGAYFKIRVNVHFIESDIYEKYPEQIDTLAKYHGVIVPGGFGDRGIEGKIMTIKYVREHNIPFLGICLGFQLAVIEYARNVIGLKNAHSTEFQPNTPYPVIDLLPEQRCINYMGATMRLGAHKILLEKNSKIYKIYGTEEIFERHRHRFEVHPDYRERLLNGELRFTGKSEDGRRIEVLELSTHKFFIATQFHAEFKSRPGKPAPVYRGFIESLGI